MPPELTTTPTAPTTPQVGTPQAMPTSQGTQGPPIKISDLAAASRETFQRTLDLYNQNPIIQQSGIRFIEDPTHPGQMMQVNIPTPTQTTSTIQTQLDNYAKNLGKSFSPDQLDKAVKLSEQGVTDLSQIISEVGQPISPTADESKTTYTQNHDSLLSALSALDTASSQLKEGGGATGIEGLLTKSWFGRYTNPKGYAYEQTKTDIAAQLTKAVTGAARTNGSVYEGFLNALPDVTDTPEVAQQKLDNVYQQLTSRASSLGFTDIISQYSDKSNTSGGNWSVSTSDNSQPTQGGDSWKVLK